MAYQSWSVVFGEQPTASKWNILGTNDASFNDGTGLPTINSSSAIVATAEATTSSTFTDLSTPGPSVTATIGSSGMALVAISDSQENSTAGQWAVMSYALSGTNTLSANDNSAIINANSASVTDLLGGSYVRLHTGLSTGSTTFTAKYRATAGTANFSNRRIAVLTL